MKTKYLAVGIILLFVGTCIIPTFAQETEKAVSVASRGTWLYVGGSGPGNYTKIQDAINASVDGDTVFVYSGFYPECLLIKESIRVFGEDRDTTVVGVNKSSADLVWILADNVTFKGFTINPGGTAVVTGINVLGLQCLVEGDSIESCDLGIIVGSPCDSTIVRGNVIRSCNFGIYVNGDSILVEGNMISSGGCGISTYGAQGTTIQGNVIQNNSMGVFIGDSRNCRVEKNTFLKNSDQAAFKDSLFTRWSRNYWNRASSLPYVVYGTLVGLSYLPWVNFDWFPARKPYENPTTALIA
jgi:parallel beta-helix repeat protein